MTQSNSGKRQHERRRSIGMSIASSTAETLLLSSSGDVITCRCRNSPYPTGPAAMKHYLWRDDIAVMCCEADCDDLSTSIQESSNICGPWTYSNNITATRNGDREQTRNKGGLLGGAPAQVAASPLHHHHQFDYSHPPAHSQVGLQGGGSPDKSVLMASNNNNDSENNSCFITSGKHPPISPSSFNGATPSKAQKAFRSPPFALESGFDEESIVPIQSFDYSQFYDGGNVMIPTQTTKQHPTETPDEYVPANQGIPKYPHGIPTFCSNFSNVKIDSVSAHPLGAHVLLISNAGLLYSYGLNNYGQLGIGMRSSSRGPHQGFVMAPTIVTPLVENGGKAIACAAGASHSLVVVETEERRLVKSHSFDNNRPGRKSTESILHHQLYGFGRNDYMKIGLVSPKVAKRGKDEMECVVLPRRVALRCSVRRQNGKGIFAIAASNEHSAALIQRATGDVELYTWGNAVFGALGVLPPQNKPQSNTPVVPVPSFVASLSKTSNATAKSSSLLLQDRFEFPAQVSLGRRCSFVVTSIGRCFSFGTSDDGMLGLGKGVTETHTPTEIPMPLGARNDSIVSVSAGGSHVIACTSSGSAYAWGNHCHFGQVNQTDNVAQNNSSKISELSIQWAPKKIKLPCSEDPENTDNSKTEAILQVSAGLDCTFLVAESGCVYSSGKKSGRLGRGEVANDFTSPRPMFGGLHLWKKQEPPSKLTPGRKLIRGVTMS